jgi:DNA polymerase III epsilon subunit-like protein
MPETVYAVVDVEASGPIPDPYNLVSIGAVAVRRQGPRREPGAWAVDTATQFYVELKPAYPGFDAEAMAIHGISREHLEESGVEPVVALTRLADWARGLGGRPVLVGHNAVFDWAYVNHYFVRTGVANPFGWKALDTKSLAAGILRLPFLETSKENLARLLPGLEPEDQAQKHRADYDALYQAHLLVELLNRPAA